MKKFKKLVSLVIASMLTAGTISAATAGAVGYFKNGDQLDAELDEYILINDENGISLSLPTTLSSLPSLAF